MTKIEAQEILNKISKFCKEEEGNKLTIWATTALIATIKIDLDKIVKKDDASNGVEVIETNGGDNKKDAKPTKPATAKKDL